MSKIRAHLRNYRRSSLFAGFVAVSLLVAPQVDAFGPECMPQYPMVVWHADPAHQALIAWTTEDAGSASVVHFDVESHAGDPNAYANAMNLVTTGEYSDGGQFYHHAVLDGLEPSTRYYFAVETDGFISEERWFVSGPEDDRPIRLLYGGDSRSDSENRRAMNDRIAALVDEDPNTIALVHGGDYINDGDDWSQWAEWLYDHQNVVTADGRMLPIVPARGNHEAGAEIYNEVFGFPGGAETNYWTMGIGPQIRFVQLDSNVSHGGDQRDFLEQELQAAQDSRWILANYHRPAFPAVKSPGDALVQWVPLFEQYNADLVCESDGHVLKRTVPIRNGEMDPTGIVYVGEGGLGVSQREPISQWYLDAPGMSMSGHHVQRISIGADEMLYEAILMDGQIADSYSLAPRREGTVILPEFVAAEPDGADVIEVELSKDMDPDRLADPQTYAIDGGTVLGVEVLDDRVVVLTTEPLEAGEHTLSGNELTDLAGNAVEGSIGFIVAPGDPPAADESGSETTDSGGDDTDGDEDDSDAETAAPEDDDQPPSSSDTDTDGASGGDADGGDGCGCRHDGDAGATSLLLLGLLVLRRRRG